MEVREGDLEEFIKIWHISSIYLSCSKTASQTLPQPLAAKKNWSSCFGGGTGAKRGLPPLTPPPLKRPLALSDGREGHTRRVLKGLGGEGTDPEIPRVAVTSIFDRLGQ